MTTLVVAADELDRERLELEAQRFHHLFRVRRMRPGDSLRLTDGAGRARLGQVESVDRRSALVLLGQEAPSNEPRCSVELIVAAPRPQRAAWLVEKATELGVVAVRFVNTERSPRSYGSATCRRLERMAVAAVEQCGRARVPEISGVHAWKEVEELIARCDGGWVLDPGAARGRRLGVDDPTLQAVAVGPEGGWAERELGALLDMGCLPVELGPRVMRVETAALVALALLVTSCVDTSRRRSVG